MLCNVLPVDPDVILVLPRFDAVICCQKLNLMKAGACEMFSIPPTTSTLNIVRKSSRCLSLDCFILSSLDHPQSLTALPRSTNPSQDLGMYPDVLYT